MSASLSTKVFAECVGDAQNENEAVVFGEFVRSAKLRGDESSSIVQMELAANVEHDISERTEHGENSGAEGDMSVVYRSSGRSIDRGFETLSVSSFASIFVGVNGLEVNMS